MAPSHRRVPGVPTLSVVIVTHDSRAGRRANRRRARRAAARRRRADRRRQRLRRRHPGGVRELAPAATVIETGANLGFAAACNRGADAALGELLCLLNPDAVPQPGWRDAIELPATPTGAAGRHGRRWSPPTAAARSTPAAASSTSPGSAGPAARASRSTRARATSDERRARLRLRRLPGRSHRELYARLGGMPEPFFLYHEDVDLSLRVRLAGGELGVEPSGAGRPRLRVRQGRGTSGATSSATAGRR